LKVAVSPEELQKLRKEKGILETIRQRDRLGEANRYLVSCWLLPSSELLDQESIYFLDASGDRISPPRFPGMAMPTGLRLQGLVLESGGCNLREYLKLEENSYSSVPVTQRLQILSEIVAAVSFLHKMGIVHFDLKPENVVNFICGPSQRTRWKLIDLDASHDIRPSRSSSSSAPGAVLSWETLGSSESSLRLTEEYAAPEVMKMLDQWMALTPPPAAAAAPGSPPPASASAALPSLAIDEKMDVWSLGLIAFLLLTNRSFWESFPGFRMSTLRQEDIDAALFGLGLIDHKERSFLEGCLQIDPGRRWSASALLEKTLFSTKNSTSAANDLKSSKEELRQVVGELFAARSQATAAGLVSPPQPPSSSSSSSSSSLSSEEMTWQFEEFGQWLVPKLEQLLSLNAAEIADLLKPNPQSAAVSSSASASASSGK
jgi:serine/threonine protein kinase